MILNNFFFYGTLRSTPILETVIGHQSDYLEFTPAFAPRSELRLVVNESFPVIVFNDRYPGVHGTLVKGLNGEDINRILFFEDVEFTPQQISLEVNGQTEQASYFSQQGVRPSDEPWSFEEWQKKDERLSVVTAELWMELYGKYSAEEADRYWNDVKQAALKKFQSQG
ncbi:gamma-glutamylcyclotransferase [Alphaproteobacteria bacterium]|nr:gamma-glutamylcyclotransferase [Alphaproteobacteria bacterium]